MCFDFDLLYVEVEGLDDVIKCNPNGIVRRFFTFSDSGLGGAIGIIKAIDDHLIICV